MPRNRFFVGAARSSPSRATTAVTGGARALFLQASRRRYRTTRRRPANGGGRRRPSAAPVVGDGHGRRQRGDPVGRRTGRRRPVPLRVAQEQLPVSVVRFRRVRFPEAGDPRLSISRDPGRLSSKPRTHLLSRFSRARFVRSPNRSGFCRRPVFRFESTPAVSRIKTYLSPARSRWGIEGPAKHSTIETTRNVGKNFSARTPTHVNEFSKKYPTCIRSVENALSDVGLKRFEYFIDSDSSSFPKFVVVCVS